MVPGGTSLGFQRRIAPTCAQFRRSTVHCCMHQGSMVPRHHRSARRHRGGAGCPQPDCPADRWHTLAQCAGETRAHPTPFPALDNRHGPLARPPAADMSVGMKDGRAGSSGAAPGHATGGLRGPGSPRLGSDALELRDPGPTGSRYIPFGATVDFRKAYRRGHRPHTGARVCAPWTLSR